MNKIKKILRDIKTAISISNENYIKGRCHQGKF